MSALAPAPARRSRRGALAERHDHPVEIAGLRGAGPLLVERRERDFMAGLFADLGDESRRAGLPAQQPRRGGGLRLFHPSQRVQTLAVLDLHCAIPGRPRLDPDRIDEAGLVVRRLGPRGPQAWIRTGARSFGWDEIDEGADPQADKRPPAIAAGHPELERRIPLNHLAAAAGARRAAAIEPGEPVTEAVTRLFPAPPATCAAAGRTLLVGVVPVVSSETTESAPEPAGYGATPEGRAEVAGHLVHFFKAGGTRALPGADRALDPAWTRWVVDPSLYNPDAAAFAGLDLFVTFLNQLRTELGTFGDTPAAAALRSGLDAISVEYDTPDGVLRRPAAEFLRTAAAILLDGDANGTGLIMPHRWGAVDGATEARLVDAAIACLDARYAEIRPAGGRFDDPNARYVARGFVRLKPHKPGCPPRLVWSAYSEPFTLAPWHESAGQPPITIAMPDLFDRDALKGLKPGVAFALPPKLAGLLTADPKKLRDGDGEEGGWTLGWICSFSIPIITICAFIVLNIFLQLFAKIFFWLPFLKICLPVPRKQG